MNEYTFIFFYSIFNEIENCFGCCIFRIKYYLVFEIKPLESKIYDTSAFPVIWNLLSSTVDYMRYFISNDKFLVLCSKTVTDKKTIFDFDSSNHVFLHGLILHHLHLRFHLFLLEHLLMLLIWHSTTFVSSLHSLLLLLLLLRFHYWYEKYLNI